MTDGRRFADTGTAHGQLFRFGVLGSANTALTAAAFYLLALVLPAQVAFTLVYAAGVTFVMLATPRYVFGSSPTVARRIALGGWYVAVYLVGVGIVSLLDSTLDAPPIVVVLGTVCVTTPLSFLGSRLLVSSRDQSSGGKAPSG